MYVDGFVVAVKTDRKAEYVALAKEAAAIFREHGATRVVEAWADDVEVGKLTSFPRAVMLAQDETVVFAWIEFPDRKTRDACMAKAAADPRMRRDMEAMPLDGARMIFGGFETILDE